MLKTYVRLQTRVATRDRDRGATAVEYGIMIALIAAVIIALVGGVGGYIRNAFSTVNNELAPK